MVSFLVPVFNAEDFVRQCVDSLLNQTHRNIEVILVDDGSTDGSGKICDEYAQKDERVKAVHQANAGVAEARIVAFDHCKGEYVSFVDADDYVDATFVEQLLGKATEKQADIVSCEHYNQKGQQLKHEHHSMKGLYDREAICKAIGTCLLYDRRTHANGMAIYLWGKLIRHSLVGKALQQGRGLWFAEDQIVLFHTLYHAERLYIMNQPLYFYVQHTQQASKRYDFSIWESQAECWRRYRQIDADHLLGEQLDMRIWKSIYLTSKNRLRGTVNGAEQFGQEIEKARQIDIIADFFRKPFLHDSLLENIKFWLLKYKLYGVYYKKVLKP